MKRILCVFLVLAVFFSFVACTKNQSDDTAKTTTTTTVEENPFEEFFEITWLTQNNTDFRENRWDELELEKMFNVDIQVWTQNGVVAAEMAPLFAAGDIPDFYFAPAAPRPPEGQYEEGLTRSIHIDLIKKWLPGYYEMLEAIPVGFLYNLVPGKTDEYLGITHCNIGSCQYFYDASCINLDWLEAVGYAFDESKLTPVKMTTEGYEKFNDNIFFAEGDYTFEELNDILRKFTEEDPDGNGVDDTYGMVYLNENQWTNMTQTGLFGFVQRAEYLYKDPSSGDTVPLYAFTPYRDYLQWISGNLEKGYMKRLPGEQSWIVEYSAATQNNKVGIIQANGGRYLALNSAENRTYPPQNILINTDEEARFVMGPLFRGPDGTLVDMTYDIDPYGTGNYRIQMIGAQVDDAKLERIFNILQYTTFHSDEIWTRYKSGIEGIHFKWSGEPYISAMIVTPTSELAEEYRGQLNVFGLWCYPSTIQRQIDNAEKNGYWAYMPFMHANGLFEKYAINPEKFASAAYMGYELFAKYTEINTEVKPQIDTVVKDFKTRALAGEIANYNTECILINCMLQDLKSSLMRFIIIRNLSNTIREKSSISAR